VTEADIISKLRGSDIPGTKVRLTIVKAGGTDAKGKSKAGKEVKFTLTRAEMRSIMNVKVGSLPLLMKLNVSIMY
jgi:hypothetical protein